MSRVATITPTEYVKRWPPGENQADVVLLDVREDAEVALAALSFATHVPASQIPMRLHEFDSSKTIIVMCHGGIRSMHVAQYLTEQGFDQVVSLTGGIDAWSREIDSGIPRY